MAWPVTLNGRIYNADDFEGTSYVTGLPDAFEDFVNHAASIHSGKVYQNFNMTNTTTQRGATITFTVANTQYTVSGSTVNVNKSFAPGQPVRLSFTTGTTLDGFLDGTVTTYNATTGSMDLKIGARVHNTTGTASFGGSSDAWDLAIGGTGDSLPLSSTTDYYSQADANSKFAQKGQNLSDLTSASTALVNLGVNATAAELNTACDGSTAKNSHSHNTENDARYSRTFTGSSTPTAGKSGDVWITGSTIKISTGSGTGNWKQVFPAIYS